jgi:acyl-CoA synthetase (AMP-forming)/AMP-acid ligase II
MGLKSVYDLLASRARETPGGSAVLAPGRLPLTYGHLHTQIRYVRSVLQTVGVERNDRVAVLLPMGPDAALACLGVASVSACAPLDPRCHADELRTYLSELRAKAVIVPAGLESPVIALAREIGIAVLKLAPVAGGEAGVFLFDGHDGSRDLIDPLTELDDLAFVLRTSGTTGRSKFVPLTNANVVATAHRVQASFELSANDRYLNVTPLFYSQGMLLTLSSLGAGGSVVCAPEFSAALFFDCVEEFHPTWYSAAPAIHQAILA